MRSREVEIGGLLELWRNLGRDLQVGIEIEIEVGRGEGRWA